MRDKYLLPLPDYAVALLMAARCVIFGEDPNRFECLEEAILDFEAAMPITADGSIFTVEPIEREEINE